MKQQKFSVYDLAVIGMMAAVCFAATYFFKVTIPTPAGPTMIKLGNGFCLMAGLLFGGMRGGLAAGIGCMIFDLMDPAFISSAPFTLIFYFTMAFLCGSIAHMGGRGGRKTGRNILAAVCGAASYMVLHLGKSLIVLLLEGSDFQAALVAIATKAVTSSINAVVGVAVAVLLASALRPALERAGLYSRLTRAKPARSH